MFQAWRLKLREAASALDGGRLDEARTILDAADIAEFHQAQQLRARLARRLVERGADRAARGETAAGWRDLEQGAALGAESKEVAAVRRDLIDRTLREIEAQLVAGNTEGALARLDELGERHALTREARTLETVARRVHSSERFARRGKFAQAEVELTAALAQRPELTALDDRRRACSLKAAEQRRLSRRLHECMSAGRWSEALAAAEELLALAPADAPAREARRRAWAMVGTRLVDSTVPQVQTAAAPVAVAEAPSAVSLASEQFMKDESPLPPRSLLWVDAVGGFLVCRGDEVTLGQPIPGHEIDVPILGDLSGRHAVIRRDGEGYLLKALRPTRVAGRTVDGLTLLSDGATIELGSGVVLRFRRPHPLSQTARLEFVSRHRTQPAADAVILLADSCVLGPSSSAHIRCGDWTRELVLFRQGDALRCRTPGSFEVDGQTHTDEAVLGPASHIAGDDFSVSLEPL